MEPPTPSEATPSDEPQSQRQAAPIFTAERARLLAAILSVMLVATLMVSGRNSLQIRLLCDFGDEVVLRVAILTALLWGAWHCATHIWNASIVEGSTWWNVGGKLNNPTWEEVRRMVLAKADDPISFVPRQRPCPTLFRSLVGFLILGCLLIETMCFFASHGIRDSLIADQPPGPNGMSANLTALLALVAAATSIFFTYRQLQAKVKADSRQAWIDKLRHRTARFIALADRAHTTSKATQCDLDKLTSCRIEMELMLNPSEKDHRLLMYLGLKLAFFSLGEAEFGEVDDVKNIRSQIKEESGSSKEMDWLPVLGPIPTNNSTGYRKEYGDLIGYMLRLSHVVLKREWERVKATR